MNRNTLLMRLIRSACACATAVSLILSPAASTAASAQEPAEQRDVSTEVDNSFRDPAAELTGQAPSDDPEKPDDKPTPTPTRTTAPNTDSCPQSLVPPQAITTSERLAPGQPTPTPLPATATSGCGVQVPEGYHLNPDVLAAAWMVVDIDSGDIVAQKDPHGRYRPASIIKALLAMVAIDELDLNKHVVASAESAAITGSAVGLGEGGTYTVDQLLHGLLMASGNDAAHALAKELGGDAEALKKVNALATKLGTTDTYAASYSGLDAAGMSTSAYDISLIYKAAFANPTFAAIVSTEHFDFPGYADHPGYELWNDNGLFLNDPDGIGGKTGYTDDAHHTFVGALNRGGRRLMAVLLDTTVEHGPRAWEQAQHLLHEAYTLPSGTKVGTLAAAPALADDAPSVTPAPTAAASSETATPADGQRSTFDEIKSWAPWAVITLVALAVISAAAASLLLHSRYRRGPR